MFLKNEIPNYLIYRILNPRFAFTFYQNRQAIPCFDSRIARCGFGFSSAEVIDANRVGAGRKVKGIEIERIPVWQYEREGAMGRIEVQDAVVFPDLFFWTGKGRGMNRAREERVEATQGVKRGAWVAKRIEQAVCDIHRAVKIDEWRDKKARVPQASDGEYGFGDSAGIGGIAQRVQCERQVDAVDMRVRM